MKTILSIAIGFYLGREVYMHYDKEDMLAKEARIKKRIISFLESNGLSLKEAKDQTHEIMNANK